jgi:ArsR family transcriptional regulator, arsenate/arsenite/antimonite-responsive transcriptional repressor
MEQLPQDKAIVEQAALFAALADPTRLKLLQILLHQSPPGCRCVNNLCHLLGVTQPAISQHLRVLKASGLVIGERRGYRIHYRIDPEGLERCQKTFSSVLQAADKGDADSCQEIYLSQKI